MSNEKLEIVPKLRFPEFGGEWKENKLGDIGEFKTSSVDKKIVEGQQLIQLVNYMNVYKHESINNASIKDLMRVSANKTQLNSSDLKKGDILFTPSSETPDDIGHSVVIFEDLKDTLYSYHLMRFRPKVKLDILYSHYFCNIPDVLRQISRVTTGSTRFTISVGGFSKIQVNIPSLKEQKKIAACLSSLDDLITTQTQKLDNLKTHKKGLMQQLFPAEGKTIPKLRFSEFSGEWDSRKLGDITDIIMGQSPDSTSYNSDGIGTYLIQGNADIKNRNTSPRIWTNTPIKECKTGDIIMTVRAPVGAIAKSVHNACIGRGVCAIRSNQHSISGYLYQFLLNFENQWVKFEQGSTFTAVNTKDVKSLKLNLPTKAEQKKIAACLSSLDDLITTQTQKIESLKTHKKGLMQQLFPATDEING